MEKFRKNIIIVLLIIVLTSCGKNTKNTKVDQVMIDINKLEVFNPLDTDNNGVFDSCLYVKLETNEEALLGDVKKIIITDNLIFISDENQKLLVFDSQGRFRNSISKVGAGPNEILSLSDYYVDEKEKLVHVYDAVKSKFYEYSFQGALKKIIDCNSEVYGTFSSMYLLRNKDLLLVMFNQHKLKYNYKILLKEGGFKKVVDLLKYSAVGNEYISFGSDSKICENDSNYFALAFLSDTIYSIDENNSAIPKYIFQGHLKHVENGGKINYSINDDVTILMEKLRKKYSLGLTNLFATNNCLLFNYFENGNQYSVFWMINQNKGYYMKDYISHNIFSSIEYIKTTYKNAFVSYIPAYKAIDSQSSKYKIVDRKIEGLLENLKVEDNPIICFYYVK